MAAMEQLVGFVGVGRMGANMARHLRDEGYTVSAVYDVQTDIAQSLADELGCEVADNLAAVTASSDIIITVVTDDESMRQIFDENDDSLLTGAGGRVFINCATITPSTHVDVEALAENAGANSLEACMASSITQARDGTLYLMCGGREEVYQQVEPLLESSQHIAPLRRSRRNRRSGQGAGQHGHEHQHRRTCRGSGTWVGAGTRSGNAPDGLLADRSQFAGARDRR